MNKLLLVLLSATIVTARSPFDVDRETKIVGGEPVSKCVPYQASLRARGSHFCGGSIISAHWILTASHCYYPAEQITVVLGAILLSDGGEFYKADQFITHPDYSSRFPIQNDVAVIRLTSEINFGLCVGKIDISNSSPEADSVATLTGWGLTMYPSINLPNHLQTIDLNVINNFSCSSKYNMNIPTTSLCTLNKSGEGACSGDSGGPLVQNGVQIGVVSWGSPCAIGSPDVFENAVVQHKWIMNKIQDE